MYSNQRRKSCNYDNYGSHSQVAAGYQENTYQGDNHRNLGYRNNNREDSSGNKQFQPRGSREYNQSLNDCVNVITCMCTLSRRVRMPPKHVCVHMLCTQSVIGSNFEATGVSATRVHMS
jgi:hypothetical protein